MTVRIGIIGTGFARRVQLPALTLVPGCRVTAIASGNRANAEAAAKDFGIPQVYEDGAELAAAPDVDVVLVSSTPDTHAVFAIAALDAGKHVLCEKPAALTAEEAQAMVAAARRRPDRLSWIDHELRYEPNRRRVRELLRQGTLGDVRHLELSLEPYLRGDGRPQTADAPWNWWFDRTKGGGLLGAVGSHLVDLCRFWTGGEAVWTSGVTDAFVRRRRDANGAEREVTADDFASFVMRLSTGAVATVTLSAAAHHGPGHLTQITGAGGTIVLTGETKLELGRVGEPLRDASVPDELWERTTPNNMWARSFVRLMRDLVHTLDAGTPSGEPATFEDGLQVQLVLDAVRAGPRPSLD